MQKEKVIATAVEKRRFQAESGIRSFACSGDGNLLAVASYDFQKKMGKIEIWETDSEKRKWSISLTGEPRRIALSADGKTLIAGVTNEINAKGFAAREGEIQAIAVQTGKELFAFRVSSPAPVIAFHPKGDLFAVDYGSSSPFAVRRTIQFRNAKGKIVKEFETPIFSFQLAFSKDGSFIAVAGLSKKVEVVKVKTAEPHFTVTVADKPYSICFSPDSKS